MNPLTGAAVLALLAGLAACGSPDEPRQKQARATGMAMEGPFATSEMAMDKAMSAAVGVDVADNWVRKMIAHHEGAIAMSRDVLGLQPSSEVAKMAQMTIDKQGAEIAKLRRLARDGAIVPASAEPYRAAEKSMQDAMMAAKGATVSETYLRKMLGHHRGAVAMADVALANGPAGAIRSMVEKTRADQQREAQMVEAMLRGEPMPMSKSESPAATAKAPPASSAPLTSAAAVATSSPVVAGNIENGARIYGETCVACHGSNGKGAIAGVPGLSVRLKKPDDVLFKNVAEGFQSPGSPMPMPARGGNPDLSDQDLADVLAYIRKDFAR